jgi:hypothetical protein
MKYQRLGIFMSLLCLIALIFSAVSSSETSEQLFSEQNYLYRTTFVRAAPGKLLNLIELFKDRMKVHDAYGAAWDLFTLGCYKDMKHWASSSEIPREKREEAAKKAGFEGPDKIGPYMRTLILMHRDTIGVAIE